LPGSKATERLRRLLVLIPYVAQHQGTSLTELAELFAASEKELRDDLNLLFLTGLPPYGPGDLIDVDVEDGRVWITMADYFSRPVRLTRPEALSVYLRGKALLAAVGASEAPALASALAKLEEGFGTDTLGELAGRVEAEEGDAPEAVAGVREAVKTRERIEIEYYSASRDVTSVRRIDPEEVFSAIGQWYVAAWDETADAERLFRADRIRHLRTTGEHFEQRGLTGAGRPLYTRSAGDIEVRLLLRPGARWVAEYYETETTIERDGSLEVVLPTSQLAWAGKLVVRLGNEVEVLEPPELRDVARDLAERTLEHYR